MTPPPFLRCTSDIHFSSYPSSLKCEVRPCPKLLLSETMHCIQYKLDDPPPSFWNSALYIIMHNLWATLSRWYHWVEQNVMCNTHYHIVHRYTQPNVPLPSDIWSNSPQFVINTHCHCTASSQLLWWGKVWGGKAISLHLIQCSNPCDLPNLQLVANWVANLLISLRSSNQEEFEGKVLGDRAICLHLIQCWWFAISCHQMDSESSACTMDQENQRLIRHL